MSIQNKEVVLGDVFKWGLPQQLCIAQKRVKRVLNASVGFVVGEMLEPAGNVAQIHTIVTGADAPNSDGGTFKLGYKGQWTTALAWNANAGTIKAAFELLSTVDDDITASAAHDDAVTLTWTTAGKKDEIQHDGRLLTDGGIAMTSTVINVTTVGSTTSDVVVCATGGNVTGILLEKVTLDDLKNNNNIQRAFLVKGPSIVDGNNLYAVAAQLADAKAAMVVLGVTIRTEPTLYQSGPVVN